MDGFANLVELARFRARRQGAKLAYAFLDDGETVSATLSYADLDEASRSVAGALQRELPRGDRVLLMYPPGLGYVTAFLGCLYAGLTPVPAYPLDPNRLERTLARLRSIIADSGARAVVSDSGSLKLAGRLAADVPELVGVFMLASDTLGASYARQWHPVSLPREAIAFLQYTSGSTSAPRGVAVSHANLMHNLACIHECERNDERSRSLSWLPAYHDMGLIEGILQPLFGGYPAYLMPPGAFLQEPLRWLRSISALGITNSGGPNFAYDLCVRKVSPEQRAQLDLRRWRVAYNGAEPVRASTLRAFAAAFAECGFAHESLCPVYGLAEATLLATCGRRKAGPAIKAVDAEMLSQDRIVEPTPGHGATAELVSCGTPVRDTRVAVADPVTLTAKGDNEVGEILLSGPGVAAGYWNRPGESGLVFRAHLANDPHTPFLRTGDLGFVSDGALYVTGRLKDVIVFRGRKLYPHDIERSVEGAHPWIRRGGVAAVALAYAGMERVVILAELGRSLQSVAEISGAALSEVIGDIRQIVSEQHQLSVRAIALLPSGALPKTSSGKLQRFACRAGWLAGKLPLIAQWPRPCAALAADEAA